MKLVDPLHHDLEVAQVAEAAKQGAAGFFHGFPLGVWVEGVQAVGHRTTATQGDAQIVHGICREVSGDAVAFFEHAQHPIAQAGGLFLPS